MKRQIAFLVSAMMTVNLFTAVPAFATDDFSDAEVVVEEDSNEDAEEMEIQDILNRHPYDVSGRF